DAAEAGPDARPDARPDAPVAVDAPADVPVDRPAVDVGSGTCAEGTTRPCYTGLAATRGVGLCADGFQRCVGGRWGVECNGELRPQTETCNTIDDDCDGVVDNITTIPCYTGPPGTRDVGICHGGMQRCEGAMTPRCIGQVVPETREVCANGRDDNCNNMVDEAACF
ncbi:MAG: Tryptophan synthase alpha chain, partial [Myxococcaceae bacterium]|nr:Tryptophan synthase alpha chain [Myxococcaceae bacterium]